jgi:hypothetical protein
MTGWANITTGLALINALASAAPYNVTAELRQYGALNLGRSQNGRPGSDVWQSIRRLGDITLE